MCLEEEAGNWEEHFWSHIALSSEKGKENVKARQNKLF